MNDRYFGCSDCREYTDAGYRWAYWTLEKPGIVVLDTDVAVGRVLAASDYWPPDVESQSDWLSRTLPIVRSFLTAHAAHAMVYFDFDRIARDESFAAHWKEVAP